MYDQALTDSMRQELITAGVIDLSDPGLVDGFMKKNSFSSAILVNSVCGCAAGTARPAFIKSLAHAHRPLEVGTVFAGVDRAATEQARTYFVGYAASSPAMAFFREGNLVYFLGRENIEGVDAPTLNQIIGSIYDKFFQKEIQEDQVILDQFQLMEMSVAEVKQDLKNDRLILLDCRDESQRALGKIGNSRLLTQELADEMVQQWDRKEKIVVYCDHGINSRRAVSFFKQYNFENIYSLRGGVVAWSKETDSSNNS